MSKNKTYKCYECGLHYENEKLAKDCYDYCLKYRACNIEIAKHSVEHKELVAKRIPKQPNN